jgi:uncharacterized protein YdeI (YjbR/CyaY-like superfamily)
MIWPEAVDQALCFGWIDSVRKCVDDTSYMNRFTQRKPWSTWSAVNIERVEELTKMGLMWRAGLRAFELRNSEIVQRQDENLPTPKESIQQLQRQGRKVVERSVLCR